MSEAVPSKVAPSSWGSQMNGKKLYVVISQVGWGKQGRGGVQISSKVVSFTHGVQLEYE